ncbi:hypothetical protein JW851_04810 [Candidatus Woesearchaeota archaeon]|nr:hypothetical protein [Candidatus Woesearchaeota archaeon]
MKKIVLFLILLLVLSACGPKISGELKTRQKIVKQAVEVVPPKEIFIKHNVSSIVKQIHDTEKIEWGFDENKNLVRIQDKENIINFYYKDGLLRKISDGDKSVELEYFNGFLSSASGNTELPIKYSVEDGLLRSADDYVFTYNEESKLWIFKEALGVGLTFYYEKGNLDFFKKGNIVTHFYYTDKNQVKHVEDGQNHLILAYGRGQNLASLSGNIYGLGEMFDYSKGRISIISNVNETVFYGEEEVLKKVFDMYLSCTRVRRDIGVFEPIAYVVYNNYFGRNVYDYMLENFYCEWIP